jgi:hypothetical protein
LAEYKRLPFEAIAVTCAKALNRTPDQGLPVGDGDFGKPGEERDGRAIELGAGSRWSLRKLLHEPVCTGRPDHFFAFHTRREFLALIDFSR